MLKLFRSPYFYAGSTTRLLSAMALFSAIALAVFGPAAMLVLLPSALAIAVVTAPEPVARRVVQVAAVVMVAAILLWPVLVFAQAASPSGSTVDAGAWFSDIRGTIEAVVSVVVGLILSFLSWLVKKNLGISIDAKYRDALQTALMNGVHLGLDHVEAATAGDKFDLRSDIAARAVTYAHDFASGAIKHFKLDDAALAEMARAQLAKLLPAEAVANVTGVSAARVP